MLQVLQQAGVHKDESAGYGKSVERTVKHDIGLKFVRLRRQRRHDTIHYALHVQLDFGIFHQRHGRFDQRLKLASHFHFIRQTEFLEQSGADGRGPDQQADQA